MYRPTIIATYMPATLPELVRRSGASMTSVKRYIRRMRKDGLCHVSSYRPPTGPGRHHPVFTAGPGVDAVSPPALTSTETVRRHYARKRQRESAWMAALTGM